MYQEFCKIRELGCIELSIMIWKGFLEYNKKGNFLIPRTYKIRTAFINNHTTIDNYNT